MAEKVTDCELCKHISPSEVHGIFICRNKDSSRFNRVVKSKRRNVKFCGDYHER